MNIFLGNRPNLQHVNALRTCRELPALKELFEKVLDETKNMLIYTNEVDVVYRLQGRAGVLKDFLEALEVAPSVLDKLGKS